MAVYVTGDKHQDFRFIYEFANKIELKSTDYLIVLGDMGLFWRHDKADAKVIINDFESRFDFNLYFIDGNHENFDILNSLPEDENGMGYISEHIRHLKRGRHYIIDGKSFLTIGGADSIDKYRRTEGLSWWKDEAITAADIERVNTDIYYDYVLTHTCPTTIFNGYKPYLCTLGNIVDDENPDYHISGNQLDKLLDKLHFGQWYFGHYHVDRPLNEKFTCFFNYFDILE